MAIRSRSALLLALALGSSALPAPALAADATLVADLNPTRSSVFTFEGFQPRQLTPVGGRVVFAAFEQSIGNEIWASDGTDLGTRLLRDTCPGGCSSDIRILGTAGGVAYFLAGDSFDGWQLWRTDGTPAGTFQILSSLGVPHLAREPQHAAVGGTFFFFSCRDTCELWRSDGSRAGTVAVRDVGGSTGTPPSEVAVVGSTLYFLQEFGPGGPGLWRSDGTAAGTVLVRSLLGNQRFLAAAGTRVFFFGREDGEELWTSDGTAAGTRPVTDFAAPEPFERVTAFLKAIGDRVYFVADDVTGGTDLWSSDGTAAGTRRVTDFGFAHPFQSGLSAGQLAQVGGRLLFPATDGIAGLQLWSSGGTPATTAPVPGVPAPVSDLVRVGARLLFVSAGGTVANPAALWTTDGTAAGTARLRPVCQTGCSGLEIVPLAGQIYFVADAAVWRSNGTVAGTRRLLQYRPNSGLPEPFESAALPGRVLFGADDGGPYGPQLWSSDGTPAGTRLVTVVGSAAQGSFPVPAIALGDDLLFSACDGTDRSLFRTGGQGATVLPSTSRGCSGGDFPRDFTAAGGQVFYLDDGELYRTDGTDAGTRRLTDFGNDRSTGPPVVAGGQLLFPVTEFGQGFSFWTSDGTAAGTVPLLDLPDVFYSGFLTATGADAYFVVSGEENEEVWRTDGTAAGTRRVAELAFGFFGNEEPEFTRVGGAVYFAGEDDSRFDVLWRSDGTAAGTAPVPRRADGLGIGPRHLVEFGGALYFFGGVPANQSVGLIRTDGTAAGTVLLKEITPPERGFRAETVFFTALGPRLYFVAEDAAHGLELWATDGTAAGTVLVRDLDPGPTTSQPRDLHAAGGRLFFSADDGVHGVELWQTDGTAAGTLLVQDLAPGPLASHPQRLTAAGGRLYFSADDGVWGDELWSLPLAAGPACQPSAAALCLNGGRFRAEAAWRDFAGRTGTGTAVALSADTGYFWFFDPANVEAVLKVLDGRGTNGHFWAFYGALSNVEYSLTITDTQTGAARRYFNPTGRFASVGDTTAFGPLGAAAAGLSLAPTIPIVPIAPIAPIAPPLLARRAVPSERAEKAPCVAAATRLCLNGNRFALEATWRDFTGRTGVGTAVPLTADTGYFWFFDAANVEAVVKVLDGRPLNGKFWLFYGALSNVEYTLTVTDTETGERKTYTNPLGRFASGADTGAF